jgi:TPP-dependent trihydroxycyclohexane-1,2-dione (THcHDO) dehydratase
LLRDIQDRFRAQFVTARERSHPHLTFHFLTQAESVTANRMAVSIAATDITYGVGRNRKDFAFVSVAIEDEDGRRLLEIGVADTGDETKILEDAQDRLVSLLQEAATALGQSKLQLRKR